MSDFHDVLFPVDISYGSSGGPKFNTPVWEASSGYEARIQLWLSTRAEYDVSHGIKDTRQMEALTHFFMARRGKAFSFRFLDHNDYQSTNVFMGAGDYATHAWQAYKLYESNGHNGELYTHRRDLRKVAWNSEVGVKIDGVRITKAVSAPRRYSVDYRTGVFRTNAPMWGGRYAGAAPFTAINFRTNELPPNYNTLYNSTVLNSGLYYSSLHGKAYFLAGKNGKEGVIRVDIEDAEADVHASSAMMSVPGTRGLSAIGAVSAEGKIYATVQFSNTVPLVRIDGLTMQWEAEFGIGTGSPDDERGVGIPWGGGCVTRDERYLLWPDLWGNIDIHRTDSLNRIARLGRFGGLTSQQYIASCPYTESGFAFLYRPPSTAKDAGIGLYIWTERVGWHELLFGRRAAEGLCIYGDRDTGGLLIFWQNEEDGSEYDQWAGLYLPEQSKWLWQRRMPPSMSTFYSIVNGQTDLNGQLCWVRENRDFGRRVWMLETRTGRLTSRSVGTAGPLQAFDPVRQKIILKSGALTRGVSAVVSTDVLGVHYTPPEELTIDSLDFHIEVRFDTDHLNVKHDFWTYRSWDSIPLVEVRDWNQLELD